MSTALAGHVKWIHRFLLQWIDRVPEDRLLERVKGQANCALWNAGHIAASRRAMARQLDLDLGSPDWLSHFGMGADGTPSEDWPSLPVIAEDLKQTAQALSAFLKDVSSEFMAEEIPHHLSDGQVSREETPLFLLYHEGFHAGQIELARRLLDD